MANYNKKYFRRPRGPEGINKSHFSAPFCDMEKIMGRADNAVRKVLNYASEHFLKDMPIVYALTVVSSDDKRQTSYKRSFRRR